MRSWVAALVGFGIALVLVPLSSAAPRTGGTFRVAQPAQSIDTIDAAIAALAGDSTWATTACASLMHLQDKPLPAGARVAPELAAGFPKVAADGRTYVFTIRRDARFSTGATVTARDVAFTINRVLSPSLKSQSAAFFEHIVGAQDVLHGRATTARGIVASGRELTIRLTQPVGDFVGRMTSLCVLPANLSISAGGLQAPVPSAAPYYISQYVPQQTLVLTRNPYYQGPRPQHVDRFVFDLTVDFQGALDAAENGSADYAYTPNAPYAARAAAFAEEFGVNKSRFFVEPSQFLRMFVLNTSRPLLHHNVRLRQAINFAVERTALLRAGGAGRFSGVPVDQFVPPDMPGYDDAHVYPLVHPNVAKARSLASGHTRSGALVLYVPATPPGMAQAEIVKRDLARIGLAATIESFPLPLYFEKLANPTEPFDMAYIGWLFGPPDAGEVLTSLFDSHLIGTPSNINWSYFNSRVWDRALGKAARLTGEARYRTFGQLDVRLARDGAPAVAYGVDDALTLVSARTGCVIVNPYLDLAAVCLK